MSHSHVRPVSTLNSRVGGHVAIGTTLFDPAWVTAAAHQAAFGDGNVFGLTIKRFFELHGPHHAKNPFCEKLGHDLPDMTAFVLSGVKVFLDPHLQVSNLADVVIGAGGLVCSQQQVGCLLASLDAQYLVTVK